MREGMIKVSLFVSGAEDEACDLNDLCQRFVKNLKDVLGKDLLSVSAEKGISGGAPGSFPPYSVIIELFFKNIRSFDDAFVENGDKILAGLPSFFSSKVLLQVSEIIL